MLKQLSISNFALIDELHMQIQDGLTTITGETGAGKSIILGALRLVLGERADLQSIKSKDKKCIIEASFHVSNNPNIQQLCKEYDLDYEEESIIRREILPSGKSRAFFNDSPIALKPLKEIAKFLVDIHSQYDTAKITHENFGIQLCDGLAKNSKNLTAYKAMYSSWNTNKKQLKRLSEKFNETKDKDDYNRFLLQELEEANLQENEFEDLENELKILSNAVEIETAIAEIEQIHTQENYGVESQLNAIKNSLAKLNGLSDDADELISRFTSVHIELEDVLNEVSSLQNNLNNQPGRLNEIEERMSVINDLFRKHKCLSTKELIGEQEKLSSEFLEMSDMQTELSKLEKEIAQSEVKLKEQAQELTRGRTKAIPKIIKQIEQELALLGMPKAQLKIQHKATAFNALGADAIELLFSANEGMTPLAIDQAASGGERSRLMLAIKHLVARTTTLPTLILDEIDTGVSGKIADAMGKLMQAMAKESQIIAITHLPQVAAKGNAHFKVFKDNATTQIKALQKDERIQEIAELLSGESISDAAKTQAKALLLD